MSKVRVYDLAKEFGLKSKELADKLVAMGYPVASHSSSVDEDMAADIRRKLSGEGVAVHTDGRIGLRGRAAEPAPAKGATVIRRLPHFFARPLRRTPTTGCATRSRGLAVGRLDR